MVLRFFIGIIFCIVIASGILFYCFQINLITDITGFALCPFHTITGIPCPGCGMSRAFILLGQFRIREALEMNIFSLFLLGLMLFYLIKGRIPLWMKNKYLVNLLLCSVLIFWIIRIANIFC